MRFLRQNVFLLAVIGVVVVAGGIMLAMVFSGTGDLDELVKLRTDRSKELRRLAKDSEKANKAVIEAEKERVESIRDGEKEVLDRSAAWNRRTYPILTLTYTDDDGTQHTVPAFPIDRNKYRAFGLVFQFTEQYRQKMLALLKHMNATSPPNQDEIDREQTRIERQLASVKKDEEDREARANIRSGPAERSTPRDVNAAMREEEMMMMMRGRFAQDPRRSRTAGPRRNSRTTRRGNVTAVSAEAEERGLRSVRIRKARLGDVYATVDAFDLIFVGEDVSATDDQLWRAQINLWVTQDIAEAIRETNRQVMEARKIPAEQRNVLNAPVKRLVEVYVEEDYYTGGAAGGASSSRSTDDMGMGGFDDPYGGYGDYMMDFRGGARGSSGATAKAAGPAPTLTERACSTTHDVIHYSFTVVMPARYLPRLEENLMRRNNHTVLRVEFSRVDTGSAPSSGSRGATGDLHYYGTSPVVQVTIMGELLLLTSWERGTWDSKANEWSKEFPPLMPVAVLQRLNNAVPSAMRSEDQKRIPKSTGVSGYRR